MYPQLVKMVCGLLLLHFGTSLWAQPPSRTSPRSRFADADAENTTITVEIITGKQGVGFSAQQWRPIFEELGVSLRIRQGTSRDKIETTERTVGTLRQVTVVGKLERDGRIRFADRSFSRRDKQKLTRWFDGLKTYGAQGSPDGQPLWGLSKEQFADVYQALSEQLAAEVNEMTLVNAVSQFKLTPKFNIRWTDATRAWIRSEYPGEVKVRQSLKGMGKGTALAVLLNDFGLGVRPERTPRGTVDLVIDPLYQSTNVWPIGWELKLSRAKTAPKMFQLVPVEFEDVSLADVFTAVEAKTGVPILVDHYRIEAKGLDIETLTVSHPSRKTSWSLLLRRVTVPNKLSRTLKIDERGQPLVWITTLEPTQPKQ